MFQIKKNSTYLAIIILVGGKSTRFGSDKGLYEFNGKPLIFYQIEALSQLNHDVFLVANSIQQIQNYIDNVDFNDIMGFVIDDKSILSDSKLYTPLLGLYSGFKELNLLGYQKTLALACDAPLIKLNVIEFLIEQSEGYDCCVPRWNSGYIEPLFAIYPVKAACVKAKENLRKKAYKLTNLIDENWKVKYVSIEKSIRLLDEYLLTFTNINNPHDIEKLMKIHQNE